MIVCGRKALYFISYQWCYVGSQVVRHPPMGSGKGNMLENRWLGGICVFKAALRYNEDVKSKELRTKTQRIPRETACKLALWSRKLQSLMGRSKRSWGAGLDVGRWKSSGTCASCHAAHWASNLLFTESCALVTGVKWSCGVSSHRTTANDLEEHFIWPTAAHLAEVLENV